MGYTKQAQLTAQFLGDGVPQYAGNTRHVCRANSNAHKFLQNRVDSQYLYAADGTADDVELQAAIDASLGGQNDYIVVYPGAYALTAAITLAGKSNTHFIAANGIGYDIGCIGSAALTQGGNYAAIIASPYCEIGGFQIINKAGYAAITIADAIWRNNIHNNYFHMVGGGACSIITGAGSGMSWGRIARNRFSTLVGGNLTSAISISGAMGIDVCNNWIDQYNGTMDVAINLGAGVQGICAENYISDCGGGGVITVGIAANSGVALINNRGALATGTMFSGGTANRSFVDNRDAYAGGETCIES